MPVRRLILLTTVFVWTVTGCTRSRSTPEPVSIEEPVVITAPVSSGGEPLVTFSTPAVDTTAAETATAAPTATRSTINYTVQEGDTISSVALKFEAEMETLRQLNRLLDDSLFVGQVLQIPYREGLTAEGLPTPTPEPYRYVVVAGDTLGTIAESFAGVSAVAIMEANAMSDPNSLYVGQALIIPGYAAPAAASPQTSLEQGTTTSATSPTVTEDEAVTHVVQPGDTLYGIAEIYNIGAPAIISANNIANGNQLRVGQQLTIPGITRREAAAARGRVHIIQSGENLSSIADLYGVTAEEIIEFNGITDPDTILVGQQLIIPGQ